MPVEECPYSAEEVQGDAIKCRYCFSDLRGDVESAMQQGPGASTAASAPTASTAATPSSGDPTAGTGPPSGGATADGIRYTHSGFRYVLGFGPDSFGIWDRQSQGAPIETFPRTDEGWRNAWVRYVALEPNHVEVPTGTGPTGAPAPSTGWQGATTAAPEPGDDQVLQYTHSGVTYLLGYGRTFFGIWTRNDPSAPMERFARDDAGWAAAWRRFTALESNYTEVRLGS